jgi:hypothetical protein
VQAAEYKRLTPTYLCNRFLVHKDPGDSFRSQNKSKMIYPVVLALALATASAKLFPGDHVQQKAMWESYKREHGRNYATMDEETQRFGFFLENLKVADLRNDQERKNGGTALHGVTKFSDLSQAEFQAGFLTADVTMKGKRSDTGMTGLKPPRAEAGLVDWSGIYTTPVKDQVSTCSVQLDMRKVTRSCSQLSSGLLWFLLGLFCH